MKLVLGFGMGFLQLVILIIPFYNSNTKYFGKAATIVNVLRAILFFFFCQYYSLILLI